MRTSKILLFIVAVIFVLGLIATFFPREGVHIGKVTLRFPSIEEVATRNVIEEEPIIHVIDTIPVIDSLKQELMDTLSVYKQILTEHPGRFYLPDDDLTFFDPLFEEFEQAKAKKRVIRILHYGDSQIEMDRISVDLRAYFQEKFGGGGPGLLPLAQDIHKVSVSQSVSGAYDTYSIYGTGLRTSSKEYGVMARFFRVYGDATFSARAPKSGKTDSRLEQFSRVTLLFQDRKGGFATTLKNRDHHYELKQENLDAGIHTFAWTLDTPVTRFTLSLHGTADIYGIAIDDGYGVNLDNIPIRGSSGTFFSTIEDSTLAEMYKLLDVGLIILQFGGNSVPGISGEKGVLSLKEKIAAQIKYFKRIYPEAKILFIGPSDMSTRVNGTLQTYPKLPAIVQALKEAATENGAAFWDMYEVMGGKNSMLAWVRNGLAGNDYIHFTPAGANKISTALANTFELMYNHYKTKQALAPTELNVNMMIEE